MKFKKFQEKYLAEPVVYHSGAIFLTFFFFCKLFQIFSCNKTFQANVTFLYEVQAYTIQIPKTMEKPCA